MTAAGTDEVCLTQHVQLHQLFRADSLILTAVITLVVAFEFTVTVMPARFVFNGNFRVDKDTNTMLLHMIN